MVTTVTPMKRGLKDQIPELPCMAAQSYNRYPDEKGTESDISCARCGRKYKVTTVTPMKRGLKDVRV